MTVRFTIEADGKKAEQALARFAKAMEGTTKKTDKAGKAAKTANQRFEKFAQVGLKAAKVGAAAAGVAFVAMAAGAVKVVKAVIKISDETGKLADNLAKTSRAYGVAAQDMQAWTSAAGMAGVDAKQAERAFLNVGKSAYDASQGLETSERLFRDLGVSAVDADGKLRSSSDLIREISDNISKGLVPAEKEAAVVSQLFRDRSGKVLLALKAGPAAVDEAMERLERYGALMSGELLKVSEEYVDSQQRMTEATQGFKNAIAEGALPAMAAFNNTLAEFIGSQNEARDATTNFVKAAIVKAVTYGSVAVDNFDRIRDASNLAMAYVEDLFTKANLGWMTMAEKALEAAAKVAEGLHQREATARAVDALRSVRGEIEELNDKVTINRDRITVAKRLYEETGRVGSQFLDDMLHDMAELTNATDRASNSMGGLGDELEDAADKAKELDDKTPQWVKDALARQRTTATVFGQMDMGQFATGINVPANLDFSAFGGQPDPWGQYSTKLTDANDAMEASTSDATDKMISEYAEVGRTIGSMAASIGTATDKTEALKQAGVQALQTIIGKIAEAAIASVAATEASTTAGVAGGVAITAANTPAAITTSIATEGGAAAGGAAAFAAAIAAMAAAATGLLSGIGEKGLPGTKGGSGRSVVSRKNSEMLMDDRGTTKFHGLMDTVQSLLDRQGGSPGNGLLRRLAGPGDGGQAHVRTDVSVQLDGVTLAQVVDQRLARLYTSGVSEYALAMGRG